MAETMASTWLRHPASRDEQAHYAALQPRVATRMGTAENLASQNPVELKVEQSRCGLAGEPFQWRDPDVRIVATGWQLLLQVASDDDADMM